MNKPLMKYFFQPRRTRFITIASVLAATIAISAAIARSQLSNNQQETSSIQQTAAASTRQKERIPGQAISIERYGFEPAQITRPAGRIFLLVENRSGSNPLNLRITSQNNGVLKEFQLTTDQLEWADQLNLPAGEYTITETSHPAWNCHVTITAAP